jgi:hypothetical protein
MHLAAGVRTWRVARLYNLKWNRCISETVRDKTHIHIQFLLTISILECWYFLLGQPVYTVKPVLNWPFIKRNFILNGNIFRSRDYHSIPWLNGKLASAGKCSGPLRFRLRQVLSYKPEGRGIASRWAGFFLIYIIFPAAIWSWGRLSLWQKRVPGILKKKPGVKGGRRVGLTTLPPSVSRLSK